MFKIAFINIKNYGIFNFILIIIYEIINILKLKKFDLFYSESKTNSYTEVRNNSKKFNGPYLPTPFYILNIINRKLKKSNFEFKLAIKAKIKMREIKILKIFDLKKFVIYLFF
jgi:hypothetical protein